MSVTTSNGPVNNTEHSTIHQIPTNYPVIYSIDQPRLQPSHHIILQAQVAGYPARCLLDSGAFSEFISDTFVEKHQLQSFLKPRPLTVSAIDGRQLSPISNETSSLLVQMQDSLQADHSEMLTFNVTKVPNFDIILGMTWLEQHNPEIDWTSRSIIFRCECLSPRKSSISLALSITPPVSSTSSSTSPIAFPIAGSWNKKQTLATWHHRLGHRNLRDVRYMINHRLTDEMELDPASEERFHFCEDCALAKAKAAPYPMQSKYKDWRLNECVNMDEFGPLPCPSLNGEKYYVSFSERKSRARFTFLLHRKNQALNAFRQVKIYLENRTERKIKLLYGDNANEFTDKAFMTFLDQHEIEWRSTVPYSSTQNSHAERGHLTIMDSARAMLLHARLPKSFWGPAVLQASHVNNLCPHPLDPSTTPHEILTRSKPDIRYLRTFGCDAFAYIPPALRTKIDARSWKGIFIGYAPHQKGYVIYDPSTGRSSVHRSVTFNENGFGGRSQRDALADSDEPELEYDSDFISADDQNIDREGVGVEKGRTADINPTQRVTRARRPPDRFGNQVSHNWVGAATKTVHAYSEPCSYDEAASRPDAELWKRAVEEQLQSLLENETWEYIDQVPAGRKAIGCRWVFKLKTVLNSQANKEWVMVDNQDGTSTRYKARLVIQGFRQRFGRDYTDTYAPVMRSDILRLMLALSTHDSEIVALQMDAVSAFLNAHLTEEIYMNTPQGDTARQKFVKLLRSLYGLKQAPLEWFKVVDSFLVQEQKFTKLQSTSCLYIKRSENGRFVIVGVYVDDFPIVGHPEMVDEIRSALSLKFKMSDLGTLRSCLGIEIDRDAAKRTVFLSQKRYINEILSQYGMQNSRPVPTPACPDIKLSKAMCPSSEADRNAVSLLQANIDYRGAVGSLIWLQHTRPDIVYAVGEVARYVQDPGQQHFVALKRIFRYLRGTIDYGLLYKHDGAGKTCLVGYSDSDWAGDLDTRTSTSGYLFLLNSCPISYRAKKQTSIALSSCEAETIAASLAGQELLWLRTVLQELGFPQIYSTVLFQDNQGSIAFSKSEVNHSKMKHIAVRENFIRELVASGQAQPIYVASNDNLADIFTKALGKQKFCDLRSRICCLPSSQLDSVEGGS
jgi:hypothetical protein